MRLRTPTWVLVASAVAMLLALGVILATTVVLLAE